MPNMLNEALSYARRGWYVFPCREKPGRPFIRSGEEIIPREKTPYVTKGLNDASVDEDQIKAWWSMWPNALIGVNAGKSGLFVVDIDKKHVNGLETFDTWNINDTAGLHAITPSGGTHIVFTGIGKSSTNAKTGIDTRGEGGYFIVPPSKILEGDYAGEYKRFDDWERTPGIIPDGLMAKLFPESTTEFVRGSVKFEPGQRGALSRASLTFLAEGAPAGERNSKLFKVLADFAGCGYTKEEAKAAVLPAALRIGLSSGEFAGVLEHAYSKPRTPSIPESIQEKIQAGGKDVATKITVEEQGVMEEVLIGCLLTDNNIVPLIIDMLTYEDFRVYKNRIIFKAITKIFNSGLKVDYLTVSNEVAKETEKIKLTDISKLVSQYYINTEHAQTYASIIKEKSAIRKLEAVMDNKAEYMRKGSLMEIVTSIEQDVASIAVSSGIKSSNVLTGKQATDIVHDRITRLIRGEIQQLKTGFVKYDTETGGIYSNELIICAGRAGDGKSALSMSIINDIGLRQGLPCALFSLEMSNHEVISRLICQLTGLPFKSVYQGKLINESQWAAFKEAEDRIAQSNIYFDDSFGLTVPEIRLKVRKLMENGIKLLVIDQLEQIKGYESLPAYIKFDNICYDIKNMTKEFDIPIILNHQLNRGITDRRLKNPEPQLSDLNQAGEKPANQVWVINHKKDERGKIMESKVKVLKNRNGPTLEFPVIFVKERMLFSNVAYEDSTQPRPDSEDYTDEYGNDDTEEEPSWIHGGN